MIRVGVDGGLTVDHIVRVGKPPHYSSLGGPGLYASLGAQLVEGTQALLRAGLPTSEPKFADDLQRAGVDIGLCETVPKVPTVWVLDSPEGRRLVLAEAPDQLEIAAADEGGQELPPVDWRPYRGLDGLVLCSPDHVPVRRGGAGIVGVDPDQRLSRAKAWRYWTRISAAKGSVIFPSRLQLSSVGADPLAAARLLHEALKVPVVAKLDAEGAAAIDAEHTWVVRDNRVRLVDTTGAGDAMTGAAVAALAAGCDLATATALGVSVARLALAGWGHRGLLGQTPLCDPLAGVRVKKG
jgi:ribokinase